jgi:hypothetical protein
MNFRKHKLVRAPPADQIHWLGAGGAPDRGGTF